MNSLLFASTFVLCLNIYDAIRIDIERNLNLRRAARSRRNAHQVELTEHLVVSRHLAFTLEHADRDGILVIFGG